nr:sugar ABC transporter ATP-binding protein [Microbacterium aquimaris]
MHALEAQGIHKSYGGVRALRDVSLALKPGSVHALLGENGAGKSTLVRIMTGAATPDSGTLRLDGAEATFASTADAVRKGVAVVSQELSLFPHLSVLANMFPMREPRWGPFINRGRMLQLAQPILDQLGVTASPHAPVHTLSLADRQLVEIGKALVSEPRVLLLDEPTSALEGGATERLLGILRVLKERDVAVVFVSHLLEEVVGVCDEVTVLRDGAVVIQCERIADHTIPSLVKAMIGDKQVVVLTDAVEAALELTGEAGSGLEIDEVALAGAEGTVSFTANPGEVVGLVGLIGAGPIELLRVIAGIDRPVSGTVTLPGGVRAPRNQRDAVRCGVAYVSGDRRLGLMIDKPIWENIVQVRAMALAKDGLLLNKGSLIARAAQHIDSIGIKVPSPIAAVNALSGGNQQKVVLAKWLDNAPTTILLDDPTRGVDIGARAEIHALLRGSARAGAVVLLCSTDLEELTGACDRVLVFYRGSVCAELRGDELTSQNMLELMNTGELVA